MAMFKVAAHTGADNQGWIGYNRSEERRVGKEWRCRGGR